MINVKEQVSNDQIDEEWMDLIVEAKQLGLSFDEIQEFLHRGVVSKG